MICAQSIVVRKILPFGMLLVLGACGDSTTQSGPGGLTPEDARALDEAAEKLDAKALPPPAPIQTTQNAMQPIAAQPVANKPQPKPAQK